MKTSILLSLALSGLAFAGFEKWTNAEGASAELELVEVTESDGERVGTFRMRNGRTVELKASQLAAADAERLAAWQPAAAEDESPAAPASVFDKALDGNLVSLQGRSLKRHELVPPTEYYLFYYTASWCPPCQAFTPDLVKFYEKNKDARFEIVLVTSDNDEDAMASRLIDLLEDETRRASLREAGLERANAFHPVETGKAAINAYEKITM